MLLQERIRITNLLCTVLYYYLPPFYKDSNVCIKVFIHWSEVIQPWIERKRRGQHLV